MDGVQGSGSGSAERWATVASPSPSPPPPVGSYFRRDDQLFDFRSDLSRGSFCPFPDVQTLESGLSRLRISDSDTPPREAGLANRFSIGGGGQTQRIPCVGSGGHRRFSSFSHQETEREQIDQLQRRSLYNNNCVNGGSFGFDDSGQSSNNYPMMDSNRFLNNDLSLINDLANVPYLPRNGLSSSNQNPWGSSSHFSLSENHNFAMRNKVGLVPPVNLNSRPISIALLAKDRVYYHFLQQIIAEGSRDKINVIFNNVVLNIGELMVDPFGHHVVQKLLEKCNDEQVNRALFFVTKDPFQLVDICIDSHGTRSMQALLRCLRSQEQVSSFMAVLSSVALPLTKSNNGNHVIQHCFNNFSPSDNMYILEVVAQHCYQIAIDQHGCCMLQQCIAYSFGDVRQRLVGEIISNALRLSDHCFGNYVVQYVLELRELRITSNILRQLEGNYAYLSRDKYGSHVVQKCLSQSCKEESRRIIYELLRDVGLLLLDPYGNYVMQTAWIVSKDNVRDTLMSYIRQNAPIMRCNKYGRKLLEKLNYL